MYLVSLKKKKRAMINWIKRIVMKNLPSIPGRPG
jgi:hypothetical protein